MTLTDFLLARLAEDEWEAQRALSTLTNEINHARLLNLTSTREEILAAPHLGAPIRRMFAEVEAKRRIVGQLASAKEWMDAQPLSEKVRSDPTPPHAYYMATREAVKALAAVYSDHPDFREEWRP